jgi:DNA polymerase-3 subunit gamma/tau
MGGAGPTAGGAATAVAPAPARPAGPSTAAPALDGFAPGDEPTDEPFDPASAPKPVSVEDRAVSLLVQKLGAEPID